MHGNELLQEHLMRLRHDHLVAGGEATQRARPT